MTLKSVPDFVKPKLLTTKNKKDYGQNEKQYVLHFTIM